MEDSNEGRYPVGRLFTCTKKDRRFGTANQYLMLEAVGSHGEKQYFMFTEVEVQNALQRALHEIEFVKRKIWEDGECTSTKQK